MTIEEARTELHEAAEQFAAQKAVGGGEQRLEAAAVAFARARIDAAAGVTAAKLQAKDDEKRGVRPCPRCTAPIVASYGRWLDARTNRPHQCQLKGK